MKQVDRLKARSTHVIDQSERQLAEWCKAELIDFVYNGAWKALQEKRVREWLDSLTDDQQILLAYLAAVAFERINLQAIEQMEAARGDD